MLFRRHRTAPRDFHKNLAAFQALIRPVRQKSSYTLGRFVSCSPPVFGTFWPALVRSSTARGVPGAFYTYFTGRSSVGEALTPPRSRPQVRLRKAWPPLIFFRGWSAVPSAPKSEFCTFLCASMRCACDVGGREADRQLCRRPCRRGQRADVFRVFLCLSQHRCVPLYFLRTFVCLGDLPRGNPLLLPPKLAFVLCPPLCAAVLPMTCTWVVLQDNCADAGPLTQTR